jgi:DNA helicase-2/ATP-dependent DNA helicase PcrA
MTDTDNLDEKAGRVTLMTLHSAKGLEFPVVCIAGLEEGLFPHERSLMDESKVDEERRLFYVGITRGQQRVFLSYCLERNQYGKRKARPPSRFLRELPDATVRVEGRPSRAAPSRSRRMAPVSPMAPAAKHPLRGEKGSKTDFTVGENILHPVFGKGTVRVREVKGDQLKLLIKFENQGLKLIYPGFVELVRI